MNDASDPVTVVVTTDGPYVVTGPVTVEHQVIAQDHTGESWTWKRGDELPTGRTFSLCRCGQSQNKPFCDDSHVTAGFDGTETASRAAYAEQAAVVDGPTMQLSGTWSGSARSRGSATGTATRGPPSRDPRPTRRAASRPTRRRTAPRGVWSRATRTRAAPA